jgi:hypothetical protein
MKKIFFVTSIIISAFTHAQTGTSSQNLITFADGSTIKTANSIDTIGIIPSGPYASQIYYSPSGTAILGVDYSIVQYGGTGNLIHQDDGLLIPYRNQNPAFGTISYCNAYIYTYNNSNSVKTAIITLVGNNVGTPNTITLNINPSLNTEIDTYEEDILSFYPNPTTSIIRFSKAVNVSLFDITGKLIYEKQSIELLDISEVTIGTYLLNIIDKDGKVIQRSKILKQ